MFRWEWAADRRNQAVAAAAAVLLLIALIALLVGKATAPHPAKPPRTGGGVGGPAQATVPAVPHSNRSPRAAIASESPVTPSATSVPAAPLTSAGAVALAARTATEDLTLTAYRVTVTIENRGTVPVTDWTLVIVLPLLDLTVRDVEGAVMTRTDLRVIFTPVDSTRTVRNGGSVTVRFEVAGLGVRNSPLDCTIDGQPCTQVTG